MQYLCYIDLLPVSVQDEKVVIDYGCGTAMSWSDFRFSPSLPSFTDWMSPHKPCRYARKKLELHISTVKLVQLDEVENKLPLENNSVDYIHLRCSSILPES